MNFTSVFDCNFLILFAGVYVLRGFQEVLSLDLPDFQDIVFFSIQIEYQLLWFAAAVNSSDLFLYQLVVRHN